MNLFQQSLQTFFRSQRNQLLLAANETDTPHSGLLGAHREALIRGFLAALLPKRFAVGNGIVFGIAHRSREADLVIWDSENYPSISFPRHSHFFAESVRVVIEAKSRYSQRDLDDMLVKCRAVRDIVPMHSPNIIDDISMLQLDVASLKTGERHEGILIARHHIASAGFIFRGGQDFRLSDLSSDIADEMDDNWPDLLIFLEAGLVISKHYDSDRGGGYALQMSAGENALLVFAAGLMGLINERSVSVEDPTYFATYLSLTDLCEETDFREFHLTRPPAGRTPLRH